MAPHAFLPRGAKVLRERAGDVYDLLLETGAFELPIAQSRPTFGRSAELILLCVRRPLIEWALRQAVLREPLVEVVADRIEGVEVTNGELSAFGRRRRNASGTRRRRDGPHIPGSTVARGGAGRGRRGITRGRHHLLQPLLPACAAGAEFPASRHPFGPRVDLGYAQAASFLGDNGTFAIAPRSRRGIATSSRSGSLNVTTSVALRCPSSPPGSIRS